ncbi:transposase [Streptomyces sp. NPDC002520]
MRRAQVDRIRAGLRRAGREAVANWPHGCEGAVSRLRRKPGRPPTWTRRQLIDGIRFRIRTGVPRRDVPERYGPWARVYDLFRLWQRDGTWQRIFAGLQVQADAKKLITSDLNIDSTVCRAHRHAAGARERGPFEGAV